MIAVTNHVAIDDRDIQERFVRASGPRGQNINKVATAVELRFNIGKSSLPADVRDRLITLGGRHITTDGVLVIGSRAFRSQAQNRKAARARLVALVRRAATPKKRRTPTNPRPDTRENRLASKKRQSAVKAFRGRVERDDVQG